MEGAVVGYNLKTGSRNTVQKIYQHSGHFMASKK